MAALVSIIRDHEPGDTISITYLRDGAEWTCVATLGLRG
jgi:S1-C subfamily serine protease